MNQDDYRDLNKKINPRWQDSVSIYKQLVRDTIQKDDVVLEAGVGFSNMFAEEYKLAKKVIGVDVNEEYLEWNTTLTEKHVTPLESMPMIKDNSVDLVISSWVLEHVNDSSKVFSEIARVLKPKGKFIFITPNAQNYILIGNRIINSRIRNFLARQLTEDLKVDPMPAFYRANTKNRLQKLAAQNSLNIDNLIINGDPTYVAFNRLFFRLGILIERILSLPILKNYRVHFIGVMSKK